MIPSLLSPKSPCMLDKPEVLAEVTERPRFLPWEFDTHFKHSKMNTGKKLFSMFLYNRRDLFHVWGLSLVEMFYNGVK